MSDELDLSQATPEALENLSAAISTQQVNRQIREVAALDDDGLNELAARLQAELARRRPAPPPGPAAEIRGWRLVGDTPTPNDHSPKLVDIQVTDGEHVITFEAVALGPGVLPLVWAVDQVERFRPETFRIVCSHCPDQPEPVFMYPPKEGE